MQIRRYEPADIDEILRLFYNTVHIVNARDYTPEQLDAWAPQDADAAQWDASLRRHFAVVATEDGKIVGFGDITADGYLDRLFVHSDRVGTGVGKALLARLENAVSGAITTHASETARAFFEKAGYVVVRKQQVERKGVFLTNFVMKKRR